MAEIVVWENTGLKVTNVTLTLQLVELSDADFVLLSF